MKKNAFQLEVKEKNEYLFFYNGYNHIWDIYQTKFNLVI